MTDVKKYVWIAHSPQRLNRYDDWRFLISGSERPRKRGLRTLGSSNEMPSDDWSAVDIRPKRTELQGLRGLAETLGSIINMIDQPGVFGAPDNVPIGTTSDEYDRIAHQAHIARSAAEKAHRVTDADEERLFTGSLRFRVFMRQDDIFNGNGGFKVFSFFEILHASPPIAGLDFRTAQKPSFSSVLVQKRLPQRPQKVAIGIIDDGLAFANARFCRSVGDQLKTRFENIWLQDLPRSDPDTVGTAPQYQVLFGSDFTADDIDGVLAKNSLGLTANETAVYRRFGLTFEGEPSVTLGRERTHGTHIADIAGGYDPTDADGDNFPLFGVQLPSSVTEDTSSQNLATYALEGLRQIMDWADAHAKRNNTLPIPLIVNFSYGFQAGPKDGRSYIESEIDRLVNAREGHTVVVLPAGNSFEDRTSAYMILNKDDEESLSWVVQPDDKTESFVEIWFPITEHEEASLDVELTIKPPVGESFTLRTERGPSAHVLPAPNGAPIAGIYYNLTYSDALQDETTPKRPNILLAVNRTNARDALSGSVTAAPAGRWELTLKNKRTETLEATWSVQRDDTLSGYRASGRQSFFDRRDASDRSGKTADYSALAETCPITGRYSMSALSGGEMTLTVGAADDGALHATSENVHVSDIADQQVHPSRYTASGPIPSSIGPACGAIVDHGPAFPGIYAAGVKSGSSSLLDGTSVAAPKLTRALAQFLFGRLSGLRPHAKFEDEWKAFVSQQTKRGRDKDRLGNFLVARDFPDQERFKS